MIIGLPKEIKDNHKEELATKRHKKHKTKKTLKRVRRKLDQPYPFCFLTSLLFLFCAFCAFLWLTLLVAFGGQAGEENFRGDGFGEEGVYLFGFVGCISRVEGAE